jgi:hypothetical protein
MLGAALEKKAEASYLLAGWIQGYVAAYNKHIPETYDITPFESDALLLLMMRRHCDSNPDQRLLPVLDSILAFLHKDRIPKRSQIVRIDVDKQAVMLYVETIRKLQAELARRGHYDGAISGQFTEETKSGLGAYQTEAGIAPTGFPDQRTLWQLLRPEQGR